MWTDAFPGTAWRLARRALLPIALIALAGSGCSSNDGYPVTGKLLVNGEPAEGAYIVFHALDDPNKQSPDSARTLKDGTFAARVRQPGKYAVGIFWPTIIEEEGDVVEGDDRFEGKYHNTAQPVLKVTIQDGETPLPPISLNYP